MRKAVLLFVVGTVLAGCCGSTEPLPEPEIVQAVPQDEKKVRVRMLDGENPVLLEKKQVEEVF